jgi:serine/threonine-protein kinase 19
LKTEYKFNDKNISELIRCGLLATHRNVGTFLLSIPNAGEFVKNFDIGKKALISMFKKAKYNEISKTDIQRRKLPKEAKFSIQFHVYDLIGSDLIRW